MLITKEKWKASNPGSY